MEEKRALSKRQFAQSFVAKTGIAYLKTAKLVA